MNIQKTIGMITGALVASTLVAGVALAAAGDPTIDWWVIGAGGGSETVGDVSLGGTAGQWVAGTDATDTTHVDSGFWSGLAGGHDVFLPLVLRQV